MKSSRAAFLVALLLTAVAAHPSTLRLGRAVVPTSQEVRLRVDPRQDSFTGSVRIEIDIVEPASIFRFHAADMEITSLRLEDGVGAIHSPDIDQTVRVVTDRTMQRGKQTLTIEYKAPFNRAAVGLYKLVKDGQPFLFTQFQAIDARRAFPCWDEPSFKLPYQLTVEIPSQYTAVSNTPIAEESESDPWKTARFAATKPLPSYLIALAVGQFDYTPIPGMSIPGNVVVPRGQKGQTAVAAEAAPPVLAALEKYFGTPYPFEKNDLLAVPEFWAGAMENAGAITFRDTILLLDAKRATPAQRRNLIRLTAHELAHMWFGDLVTMEWWDDFWLNESFADWMGDKITTQLHPELGLRLTELQSLQPVMNQDGRASTVALRNRGASPGEAINNVGLAYDKGKAVLAMFEQWIGPDRFRLGVLDHLEKNAWANADALEFFAALARHAPKGTAEALATYVNQPGLPLVRAEWRGRQLVLRQSRYAAAGVDLKPLTWNVPVKIRYSDGKRVRTASVLLDTPSKTITLEGAAIQWLFPNDGAAGYYRWLTPPAATQALADRAVELLAPDERLVFLGNAGALFRAGLMPGDEYFSVLARFGADPDPQVAQSAASAVSALRLAFGEGDNRAPFAAYVRRAFGPALNRIGFEKVAGEAETATIFRPVLIALMAEEGQDPKASAWAKGEASKYLNDPTSVDAALAGVALNIAVRDGDEAMFEDLIKRFESAKLPVERQTFLGALGRFRNPAIRDRALQYTLNGPLRPTELFVIPAGGKDSVAERDRYYRWATTSYEAMTRRLPPVYATGYATIAAGCEPERLQATAEFFATKKAEGFDRTFARVSEQVRDCIDTREREMARVSAFLSRGQ